MALLYSQTFKSWFRNWTKDPDTEEPELVDQRHQQWRRYSRDPFEVADEPKKNTPASGTASTEAYAGNLSDGIEEIPYDSAPPVVARPNKVQTKKITERVPLATELKHPGPEWIHLFYDLSWTASFASLTQNGTFDTPMDYVSYYFFFAAVMWLWASQTLYSIHFYTNDWFHLLCTFFHLCVFGMIAATTVGEYTSTGYDIGNYIAHSPGTDILDPKPIEAIDDPERYFGEITASLSAKILALAFVITRIVHLAQYARVIYYLYARRSTFTATERNNSCQSAEQIENKAQDREGGRPNHLQDQESYWIACIPPQLKAVTIGLLISNPMFLAALGIATSEFDKGVVGASLRLGLWIGGFLVEVVSHMVVPYLLWRSSKSTHNHESGHRPEVYIGYSRDLGLPSWYRLPETPETGLYSRLQTVTTIILGEGINSIAGTFTFFLKAPTAAMTLRVLAPCTALIIWFIAYTYFEGPKGKTAPRMVSMRYMLWLMLHLPFLASTVLLLVGIKGQFFLTSFLLSVLSNTSVSDYIIKNELLDHPNATYWRTNANMKHFLLTRGLVWEEELDKLWKTSGNATAAEAPMVISVWSLRLSLTMAINVFKDFNGGEESIPSYLQPNITAYYNDFTQVAKDFENMPTDPGGTVFYQILGGLLSGSILGTRCIIAFAGLILISLGLQDFIHSWPCDRYQWGVITSRFVMGVILCLLLLLNLGKSQGLFAAYGRDHQRAGVFLWLETLWVLPTIALAYGVQFLVEITLARFAKKALTGKRAEVSKKSEAMEDEEK